jgi:hypothetical protein
VSPVLVLVSFKTEHRPLLSTRRYKLYRGRLSVRATRRRCSSLKLQKDELCSLSFLMNSMSQNSMSQNSMSRAVFLRFPASIWKFAFVVSTCVCFYLGTIVYWDERRLIFGGGNDYCARHHVSPPPPSTEQASLAVYDSFGSSGNFPRMGHEEWKRFVLIQAHATRNFSAALYSRWTWYVTPFRLCIFVTLWKVQLQVRVDQGGLEKLHTACGRVGPLHDGPSVLCGILWHVCVLCRKA